MPSLTIEWRELENYKEEEAKTNIDILEDYFSVLVQVMKFCVSDKLDISR